VRLQKRSTKTRIETSNLLEKGLIQKTGSLVKWNFTKTNCVVSFCAAKIFFLGKASFFRKKVWFNPKQVYFAEVTLHQKHVRCFCAAKIIMFLWSSFLYERKVVGEGIRSCDHPDLQVATLHRVLSKLFRYNLFSPDR